MADGKVVIQIDMDGKSAQSEVKSLKSSLLGLGESVNSMGSTFKSVLGANLVSSAVIAGVNALTGAVKGAFSSTIDEGAKLQQSIGGIETLFKDSAGTVKNYAQQAFETAGVSANTYMENVTSFSASLISSLGGDTAKAAELANTAMVDMSDNANKMGTDMEYITQTYQSLARGNYAMLDNLKLGYGGTKSEMERLMKDAEKLTGEHYTVGDFADTVKAIHAVQESLGITGTTAREASTTLSGSFSSMKAAWTDFKGNLADGELDITPSLQGLARTTSTFLFGNFIPMITRVFSKLPQAFSTLMDSMGEEIQKGLKQIAPNLDVDIVGAFKNIKAAAQMAFNPLFVSNFKAALGNVGEALQSIWSTFNNVISGSFAWTLTISNAVSALIGTIASGAKIVKQFMDSFSQTGAMQAIKNAIDSVITAWTTLTYAVGDASIWSTLGTVIGNVAKVIAQVVQAIADFISRLDPSVVKGFTNVLVGGVAGLSAFATGAKVVGAAAKGLNFIKSLNPFSAFKKNAEEGMEGATNSAKRSKSTISQIFNGLTNLIKGVGTSFKSIFDGLGKTFTGLGKTFEGFGKGVGAALKGLMQGLKGLNPMTLISFGAAVGIAAVGIGAGIGIIVASLSLLAEHSAGVSVIIQALGTAFATVATAIIGAFAQAIVTVSGVLPIVTSALANLAPLVVAVGVAIGATAPAITALGDAFTSILGTLPPIITALGSAISQIATAITPIVGIISSAFVQIVTVVSNAIVQIIQALAPFIPAITEMVVAVAPVLSQIVDAFNNLISQISPIIDSIANLFKTLGEQISNILDSASGVITSFGDSVRNVLDGVAGIFDSMGNAALNAGKGVKEMAQGIKILVDLKLGDLAATLATTASGLGKMASHASGMSTLGTAMVQVGTGMTQFSTGATIALAALNQFGSVVTNLKTSLVQLPAMMTVASAGFQTFTIQAISGVAGLSAVNAPIAAFKAQIMTLTPAIISATAGFAMFGARAMVITTSFAIIGGLISAFNARILSISVATSAAGASFGVLASRVGALGGSLSSISSGFASVGASASNSASQMRSIISATQAIITAFNSMRAQVQSSMQAILTIMLSIGNQMKNQGRIIGQQTSQNLAQGISSGAGRASSAMNALMSAVRSAGMSGVGSMRSIGVYIGQGLASGMMASLGSVTAAANALVAQAERAAQAKAKIHSPSRLFRDNVGRYIAQGVAVGIEKDSYTVNDALGAMYDKIQAFNYKAEDIIGVGSSNFSSSIKVKSDLDKALKTKVEIVQEKSNEVFEKAIDVMGRLADRPIDMRLNDDTLIARTSDRYQEYQQIQITRNNRMWGRP
ncbi:tape measure protein [Streptococcus gallolyticus]|uniref:tape measure protein n=1 Tax=Streptococcus gallolyticus TaxID=315405 RepID=UPI002283F329|nr:tape measure protein [Streptococcus gallolyticus]MCY7156269.1 tape measure protein [Streptococcus gallolyticus subsp. gallolyticus]